MIPIDYELKYLVEIYKPKRALDLGAGDLRHSIEMAKGGVIVDAVEPLSKIQDDVPSGITLFQIKAEEFTYPINKYDLIVFRMVAQRLGQDFVEKIFSTVFPTTLTEKGKIFFVIPNKYDLPASIEENFTILANHVFEVPESDFKTIRSLVLEKK